jgi:hypothetical protein
MGWERACRLGKVCSVGVGEHAQQLGVGPDREVKASSEDGLETGVEGMHARVPAVNKGQEAME